ncbi:alcohol dehydrogenase [Penicillium cf. griseofulvum]|nr:alcohol dehydrogenase [Penicillium cf. griseofulvum]
MTVPCKEAFSLLIYGGSTATGIAGIQFAKLSGLSVITTCSPRNFDLVEGLGADAVFDYKSSTCAAEIKQLIKNRLAHAWDCMGDGAAICAQAMSDCESGTYGTIMPADYELLSAYNSQVHGQDFVCGCNTMGENYYWLGQALVTPNPEEMQFYQSFLALAQPLLQNESIKPLPAAVNKNASGLEGVLKGLEEMEVGNVSGEKLGFTL